METFLFFIVIAFAVEKVTEYIFGKWLSGIWMLYVALAVSIGLSISYNMDIIYIMFGKESNPPIVGVLFSAAIIGGGSSLLHDVIGKFLSGGDEDEK